MVLCKDFSTEKRRNNTREKIFFHVCLASPISAVRATRSGFFFFFFHFFTLLFFIFLHITRYSSDPRIANANRGGSNLFIYSFMPRDLIWDGVVRKRDSLDHIHPKPANLGEQLPITGIKDLLTAANRLLDPTEELWSFWLLLQWQFRNHRGSVHWKIRFGIPYNRKGKYWCPSIFAIYLEINHKKKTTYLNKR